MGSAGGARNSEGASGSWWHALAVKVSRNGSGAGGNMVAVRGRCECDIKVREEAEAVMGCRPGFSWKTCWLPAATAIASETDGHSFACYHTKNPDEPSAPTSFTYIPRHADSCRAISHPAHHRPC